MRLRDLQRERVYLSEADAGFWNMEPLADHQVFSEYVVWCMNTQLVETAWPKFLEAGGFDIKFSSKNSKRSWGNAVGMKISPQQFYKHVALHELAHIICIRQYERIPAHGWQWCSTYLTLLGWFLSLDARNSLIAQFDKRNVHYREDQACPDWIKRGVGVAA